MQRTKHTEVVAKAEMLMLDADGVGYPRGRVVRDFCRKRLLGSEWSGQNRASSKEEVQGGGGEGVEVKADLMLRVSRA